jgi:hypothetical protein
LKLDRTGRLLRGREIAENWKQNQGTAKRGKTHFINPEVKSDGTVLLNEKRRQLRIISRIPEKAASPNSPDSHRRVNPLAYQRNFKAN